jgi:hypothetical protein
MDTNDHQLVVGETYYYNFGGAPGGRGVFEGFVQPIGYIALRKDNDEVAFFNPALLCVLKPVAPSVTEIVLDADDLTAS